MALQPPLFHKLQRDGKGLDTAYIHKRTKAAVSVHSDMQLQRPPLRKAACGAKSEKGFKIALHLSEGSPISLAGTPVPVDLLTKPFTVSLTGALRPVWVEGNKLLRWFAEESRKTNKNHQDGDIGACLHFTDELNKEDRCKWHIKAAEHGLASMSEGMGRCRTIRIIQRGRHRFARKMTDGRSTPQELLETTFSRDLWLACHLEGGTLADYSQEDINIMCSSSGAIPPELSRVHRLRLQVRELTASIRMGAFVKAVNVIQQDPEVLFKVEEDCFGYPVHLACALGETHLAQHMFILAKAEGKDLATFLDARGNNPIQMAQAHGQRKCVDKLTQFLKEQPPAILPPNPQVVPRAAFSKVKVAPPPPPPPEVKATSNPNVIEVHKYEPHRLPLEDRESRRRRRGGTKRGGRGRNNPPIVARSREDKSSVVVVNREQIRRIISMDGFPSIFGGSQPRSSRGRRSNAL